MNLKSIQINLALGQDILVGHKQEKATITKIEHFEKLKKKKKSFFILSILRFIYLKYQRATDCL